MKYYFTTLCWLFLIGNCFFFNYAMGEDVILSENIIEFISEIINSKEDIVAKEQKLLNLFQKCKKDKDKGIILVAIAKIYFLSGIPQKEKVVIYCSKAVQYPLEILEACDVYVMWGEAIEADKKVTMDTILKGDARKAVCVPYIKAMELVLQNLKTNQRIPPSAVDKFDATVEDPVYQELKKKHEEQIEQRKYIMMQNELLWYKQVLKGKFERFYGKDDSAALKADVHEIIHDETKIALICSEIWK